MPPFYSVKSHTRFVPFCLQPCEACRHVHRKDTRILGSASTHDPATASLNLSSPTSSFPLHFYSLWKSGREASPTLKRKYLPVKETLSHQSKPRQVGTHCLQMPEGASILGGARWPATPLFPKYPGTPLPTLLADEETDVQSGHLLSVTQHPEGSFIFLESIYLRK